MTSLARMTAICKRLQRSPVETGTVQFITVILSHPKLLVSDGRQQSRNAGTDATNFFDEERVERGRQFGGFNVVVVDGLLAV
jgi:hypothetical protein